MSLNRTYPQQNSADEGFARRRMNDIVGLIAIVATAFAVSLVTGVDSPAFALVLFAAIGALAYGEQRLRDVPAVPSAGANALASWNARA